jgi:hypothetical protein
MKTDTSLSIENTLKNTTGILNSNLTRGLVSHMDKFLDNNSNIPINKKKNYVSLADVMTEIKTLSNKHNFDNDLDTEEVAKLLNVVKDVTNSLKYKLKDSTGGNFTLSFGNFEYKKGMI